METTLRLGSESWKPNAVLSFLDARALGWHATPFCSIYAEWIMHCSTAARVHQSMHLQLARISGGAVLGVGVLRGRGVHGIFESVIIFCAYTQLAGKDRRY